MRDPFSIINKITEIATKEIKCVNIDLGYGSAFSPHPLSSLCHPHPFHSLSLSGLCHLHPQILAEVFFFLSFFVLFPNFVLFLYFIGILSRMVVDAQFYDCAHTHTYITVNDSSLCLSYVCIQMLLLNRSTIKYQ